MMSDKMIPIPFPKLVNWMLEEYKRSHTIFGVSDVKFFQKKTITKLDFLGRLWTLPWVRQPVPIPSWLKILLLPI